MLLLRIALIEFVLWFYAVIATEKDRILDALALLRGELQDRVAANIF